MVTDANGAVQADISNPLRQENSAKVLFPNFPAAISRGAGLRTLRMMASAKTLELACRGNPPHPPSARRIGLVADPCGYLHSPRTCLRGIVSLDGARQLEGENSDDAGYRDAEDSELRRACSTIGSNHSKDSGSISCGSPCFLSGRVAGRKAERCGHRPRRTIPTMPDVAFGTDGPAEARSFLMADERRGS